MKWGLNKQLFSLSINHFFYKKQESSAKIFKLFYLNSPVYCHIWQRKCVNPHINEAGTWRCFTGTISWLSSETMSTHYLVTGYMCQIWRRKTIQNFTRKSKDYRKVRQDFWYFTKLLLQKYVFYLVNHHFYFACKQTNRLFTSPPQFLNNN